MSRSELKILGTIFLMTTLALVTGLPGSAWPQQDDGRKMRVEIVRKDAEKRVEIWIDHKPFTNYLYADTIPVLKKPVLFPLRTAQGTIITRGYPLEPRPGERVDHPHQIGCWFNYGDVNGLDFWNNSDAISPERAHSMGTIRHRAIKHVESGANAAVLEVTADWLGPEGNAILHEETRFVFHASPNLRVVDRITTLTPRAERVLFKDNKEGMMALRFL